MPPFAIQVFCTCIFGILVVWLPHFRSPCGMAIRPLAPQIATGRIGHRARREREVASAAAVVPRAAL